MNKKKFLVIFVLAFFLAVFTFFNSNASLRLLFPEKVWAHKINSLEELNNVKHKFKGVELDCVIKNGKDYLFFDVNHPPETSNNLSLTNYFQSLDNDNGLKFWLDLKNLHRENELSASIKLDSISNVFEIKSIIVESEKPWCLNSFSKVGFNTSYYLPANLHKLDSINLKKEISNIKKYVDSYKPSYISTEYKDYEILKKHFPEERKIFWFTIYGSMNKIETRILLYKILLDSKVDVLLIPPA